MEGPGGSWEDLGLKKGLDNLGSVGMIIEWLGGVQDWLEMVDTSLTWKGKAGLEKVRERLPGMIPFPIFSSLVSSIPDLLCSPLAYLVSSLS